MFPNSLEIVSVLSLGFNQVPAIISFANNYINNHA